MSSSTWNGKLRGQDFTFSNVLTTSSSVFFLQHPYLIKKLRAMFVHGGLKGLSRELLGETSFFTSGQSCKTLKE